MSLDFFEQQSMACLGCATEMAWDRGTLRFEDDEIEIVIENVPMYRCTACGEELIPGPIAESISKFVNEVSREMRSAPIVKTELKTIYSGPLPEHAGNYAYAD